MFYHIKQPRVILYNEIDFLNSARLTKSDVINFYRRSNCLEAYKGETRNVARLSRPQIEFLERKTHKIYILEE